MLGAGALLNLLWLGPGWVDPTRPDRIAWVPEVWLLVGLFALLPVRRNTRRLRYGAAGLGVLLLAAAFGDIGVRLALGRSLTLPGDAGLLKNGFELVHGQFGLAAAFGAALLAIVLALSLTVATARLLRLRSARAPALLLVVIAGLALALHPIHPLPAAHPLVIQEIAQRIESAVDQRRTAQALDRALEQQPAVGPLPGLAGRDLWLVFVESYGAAALEDPAVRSTLTGDDDRRTGRRLAGASGLVKSPIRGGQSWLAHATLLTGLPISDQAGYRKALSMSTGTLADDFRATGHAAVAVMPAIVGDWPEGRLLGFDHVADARGLDYRGPPLGWVTMPDEFTLRRAGERVRPRFDQATFIQVALISSHAPWTPVLPMLGPATPLDDGRVFDRWASAAPGPGALVDEVPALRSRYHASIAYSLEVVLNWAGQAMDEDALLLVVGDHPPSPLIASDPADHRVPIHVFARSAESLQPFESMGLTAGYLPDPGAPAPPMANLRTMLRDAFTESDPAAN